MKKDCNSSLMQSFTCKFYRNRETVLVEKRIEKLYKLKLKTITSSEGVTAVAAEEAENLAREIRTSKLQASEKIADRR